MRSSTRWSGLSTTSSPRSNSRAGAPIEAIAARFASTNDSKSIEDVRDHTPNNDGYDPELMPCL